MNLLKLYNLLLILSIVLAVSSTGVVAADDSSFEGTISATGKVSSINGSNAKFHEYSDDNTGGIFGKVTGSYDSSNYFLNFSATNPAYDMQHYRLDGGAYGKFRLWLDYNEIIHNITSDAKSFYNGVNSDTLSGTAGTNANAWPSVFDYSTKRKQFGTGASISVVKPFFFDVNYFHEDKEGLRPVGAESTVALELPAVVDYTTNGVTVEAGYAKNPFFLSFNYVFSSFNDHTQDMFFTNQTGAVPTRGNAFSLPADSTMQRFAMKGNAMLPMNSKINLSASTAETKSDSSSFPTFDGKVDTQTFDLGFTTNPVRFLDGKAFYKYYDRNNKTTGILSSGVESGTVANRFSYRKNSYGAELGFRLPMKFYVTGGYKNVVTNRRFNDEADPSLPVAEILPDNTDDIFSLGVRWSGLQSATFRIGYERLGRSADYRTPESQNVLYRNYAYASQVRDTFKASVDLTPTDNINIGLDYNYKKANYHDTLYGLTGDTRNAVSFTADYAISKTIRLSGYFDGEKTSLDQFATTSGATASQWASSLEDITYDVGLKADIAIIPNKLSLAFLGGFTRSNGNNDLTYQGTPANFTTIFQIPSASLPIDVPNVDSYQKYSLKLVASYSWSPSITIKAGYAYDRYKYSDAQNGNYLYILNALTTSSNAYLTGAYARPDFSVNTVFLGLIYRFK